MVVSVAFRDYACQTPPFPFAMLPPPTGYPPKRIARAIQWYELVYSFCVCADLYHKLCADFLAIRIGAAQM